MAQQFKVDQAATFDGIAFIECRPKTDFGKDTQSKTYDGTPKWEVELLGRFKGSFKTSNEVIKLSVASPSNPAEGLGMYEPVHLVDFEVGVMEKTKKNPQTGEEKIIGVQVWYRASAVRSNAASGNGSRGGSGKQQASETTAAA